MGSTNRKLLSCIGEGPKAFLSGSKRVNTLYKNFCNKFVITKIYAQNGFDADCIKSKRLKLF